MIQKSVSNGGTTVKKTNTVTYTTVQVYQQHKSPLNVTLACTNEP